MPLLFLDKLFSSVKTWHGVVQHKIPQTTHPWNCCGLQEGFPPTARQICTSTSRIWKPEHNWYIPNNQRNRPRTPIQPPRRLFFSLLTGKLTRHSHWTHLNMTVYVIGLYDTFNTKGCPDELIFGDLNDQPIPYDYYNILNDDNNNSNNVPGTPVDDKIPEKKWVGDLAVPNYEVINYEIMIIDNDDRLSSDTLPPPKRNSVNLRRRQWNQRKGNWRCGFKKWRSVIRKGRSGQRSSTPERKGYHLRNPPTINYNDGRANSWSMSWNNLIVGSHDLHNIAKAYVNVVNAIATFFEPNPPTNIIENGTILIQHSMKQYIKVFVKKSRLQYKNNCSSFMTTELFSQIILNTSSMNNEERDWPT